MQNRAMKKLIYLLMTLAAISCGKPEPAELSVMTFNIRLDVSSDGVNRWDNRKDLAADMVKFYSPDIVGMQEVVHNQLTDFLDRMPQYDYIGVGRADGATKGEYSPVFYKKDKFEVLESGNFWLAEDINAVGRKGWDAACERVATWGVFKDLKTGKKFFALNTHFDHIGQVARRESAHLLLEKVAEYGKNLPCIVTGDFNAVSTDEPIRVITDPSDLLHLTDSRGLAALAYGPEWSFHDFGRIPTDKRPLIDYIFVKGNIEVEKHGVLAETKDTLFVSDHNPLIAHLILQ